MAPAAPDKNTLTAFSKKAQDEIERSRFVAVSGGLVNLSAPTYWEIFYAAQAWHEHLNALSKNAPCMACIGTGQNIMHGHPCEKCNGTGRADAAAPIEPQPATAT